jgi:hypothetical protein
MRLRTTLIHGLLVLLAGCRSSDQRVVQVKIELPAPLEADLFRITKVIDGIASRYDRASTVPRPDHQVGVIVPRDLTSFGLSVQGIYQGETIAEAAATIAVAAPPTLVLAACRAPVPEDAPFGSCQSGVDPRPDGGAPEGDVNASDGGALDLTADAASEPIWVPPATCDRADGGAVQPPAINPPGCADYCAAMHDQCPAVFLGDDRCLFACSELGWTVDGGYNTDTISCRILWAMRPRGGSDQDTANKCLYASPASLGKACGDFCTIYCHMGSRICGEYFPPGQSCIAACVRARDSWRTLHHEDPVEWQCRLDQLQAAVFDRSHCGVAGPNNPCPGCPPIMFDLTSTGR